MSEDWSIRESLIWTNEQLAEWRTQVWEALQPGPFRQWLTRFPNEHVIGHANHYHDGPFNSYLQDRLPHLDCIVGIGFVNCPLPEQLIPGLKNFSSGSRALYYLGHTTIGKPGGRKMPEWANEFLIAIADRFMKEDPEFQSWLKREATFSLDEHPWPVTAQGAISLLENNLGGEAGELYS